MWQTNQKNLFKICLKLVMIIAVSVAILLDLLLRFFL